MSPAELVREAARVRQRAYAPYSGYSVGAALETADGTVFTGTNVENASYGLTLCAERAALAAAVSAGHRSLKALAVVTADGATPCGACRQVLHEFAPGLSVHVAAPKGPHSTHDLGHLLPGAFGPPPGCPPSGGPGSRA